MLKLKSGLRLQLLMKRLPRVYRILTYSIRCKGHVQYSQLWKLKRDILELASITNALHWMNSSTTVSSSEKKLKFRKLQNHPTSSGRTVLSAHRQEP
jgi:hypothetical protein